MQRSVTKRSDVNSGAGQVRGLFTRPIIIEEDIPEKYVCPACGKREATGEDADLRCRSCGWSP